MMTLTQHDAQSVTIATASKHCSVYVGILGVYVMIKPLSQRLKGISKPHASFEAALEAYKSTEAKAMILLAQETLAVKAA